MMSEFSTYQEIEQKRDPELLNSTAFSDPIISFTEEYSCCIWTTVDEPFLEKLLIIKNQHICQGQPTIFGTRISVSNIVELRYLLGWDIEKIKTEYPFLNEKQINAALEYYFENKNEIDNFLRKEKEIDKA